MIDSVDRAHIRNAIKEMMLQSKESEISPVIDAKKSLEEGQITKKKSKVVVAWEKTIIV